MMQQSHKLGFKIFGNMDENQTFEIQFSPGDVPVGTILHLIKQDEKKVVVELPQSCHNNFEEACAFLLERASCLVVKEQGHEKLGNRKLILETSYDLNQSPISAWISIQGKWQSTAYKIELNPFEMIASSGEIQKPPAKGFKTVSLELEGLKNIKTSEVAKVFPKLKPNNFFVFLNQDQITLELGLPLKQFIDSLGKPSKYQKPKIENPPLPQVIAKEEMSDEEMTASLIKEMSSSEEPLPVEEEPSKMGIWSTFRKMMGKT